MNCTNYNCKGYVIKQGDTLYSISRRFNAPIALLLKANPYVEVYSLQVGDELRVPVVQPIIYGDTAPYMVEENDTLESILEKFGISLDELQQFNNLDDVTLQPGMIIQIPTFEE